MSDPSFGSAPDAMTLTTLEPPPFAPSADTQSSPAAGHFLPRNPLPYLAPSATHQPELLLLSWMIATLDAIVTDLQNHPLVSDPIPYPSSFTDQRAYRLYLQSATPFATWGPSTPTYAKAYACSSSYLAHQAPQAFIARTQQRGSHLQQPPISSPLLFHLQAVLPLHHPPGTSPSLTLVRQAAHSYTAQTQPPHQHPPATLRHHAFSHLPQPAPSISLDSNFDSVDRLLPYTSRNLDYAATTRPHRSIVLAVRFTSTWTTTDTSKSQPDLSSLQHSRV